MSARGEQGLNRGVEWRREQRLRERDVCKRGTGTEQGSGVGEGTRTEGARCLQEKGTGTEQGSGVGEGAGEPSGGGNKD